MHISYTKGDFVFALWNDEDCKKYKKKIHELRCLGYRKINQEYDFLNCYEYYRRKGKKKVITVTQMLP